MVLLLNPVFLVLFLLAKLYSFGSANDKEISRLSADFSTRLVIFLLLVKFRFGYDVTIVDGLRTPAEQAALHRQNPKNPATPGDHGDGNAADLNFSLNGKAVLLKGMPAAKWRLLYVLAANCGIANGSVFPGYADNNHFFIRTGSNSGYAYYLSILKQFLI